MIPYKTAFKEEFKRAKDFLFPRYMGELTWSYADYQAFIYKTDGVRLIFYPHTTSARNQHIRVRDGGSKNKIRAQAIMDVIQFDLATDCTFTQKANHCWLNYNDKTKEKIRKIAYGVEQLDHNQLNKTSAAQ